MNVIRLVRTDLLKQRTVRLFAGAVAAAPVIGGLVVLAVFGAAGKQGNDPLSPESLVQVVGAPSSVITIAALLLGVLGMAGEYRHQTITTTYLATPRRRDVVVSKLGAHALTGVAMAVGCIAGTLAVAIPWLQGADVPVEFPSEMARVVAGLVVSSALHAALGVAIGALIRNQTAAVAAVLVWFLAVEGLLSDLLRFGDVVHWFPGAVAAALVRPEAQVVTGSLPLAAAAAVFTAYVAIAATAGIALQTRKDIS